MGWHNPSLPNLHVYVLVQLSELLNYYLGKVSMDSQIITIKCYNVVLIVKHTSIYCKVLVQES